MYPQHRFSHTTVSFVTAKNSNFYPIQRAEVVYTYVTCQAIQRALRETYSANFALVAKFGEAQER